LPLRQAGKVEDVGLLEVELLAAVEGMELERLPSCDPDVES
jgi:hypothetical protein